jgi:hypothetical protein
VKTLLATIHIAVVGCHGNLVYRVVSWIPVLGNLWEVPVEGSHICIKLLSVVLLFMNCFLSISSINHSAGFIYSGMEDFASEILFCLNESTAIITVA